MVEIIAIVNRSRALATKAELNRIGCCGYTQWPVLGRGRQRGLQNGEGTNALPFLPKVLFNIIIDDEQEMETIEAVIRANQTGQYGDGRIFGSALTEATRISTGEQYSVGETSLNLEEVRS